MTLVTPPGEAALDDAVLAAEDLAQRVGSALMERDRVGRSLGIALAGIGPGWASMEMTVRDDMINGHDICHGAYLFALADTACAYAGNSRNVNTLSQGVSLAFVAPALKGERLSAEARECVTAGRSSYYDVCITRPNGDVVAILRGHCRTMGGAVLGAEDAFAKT